MTEGYEKNSLLGQLEKSGLLEDNAAISAPKPACNPFCADVKIVKKRLNDLDLNIFQDGNYLDINDIELSDREKARKIEELIKKIDEKIFMLEDSDDDTIQKLKDEKAALERAYALLADSESSLFKKFREKLKTAGIEFLKLCPFMRKNYLVHHALQKLIMLNESTKELIYKKIPYGEQEGRYSDFATYLNCANIIHAKLRKKIK